MIVRTIFPSFSSVLAWCKSAEWHQCKYHTGCICTCSLNTSHSHSAFNTELPAVEHDIKYVLTLLNVN